MTIKLDVVSAERAVFSGQVNEIVAPGADGQMAILPHHTPLISTLKTGRLEIKCCLGDRYISAIGGGFIEVLSDRVVVLADTAERADEIDIRRAETARYRAQGATAIHSATGMDKDEKLKPLYIGRLPVLTLPVAGKRR